VLQTAYYFLDCSSHDLLIFTKKMTKKVPVLIGSLICCCLLDKIYAIDHSFVEGLDTNLHKIHRSLLQDDTGISSSNELDEASPPPIIEEVTEAVTEAPIVYKGLAEPGTPELGPKLFYDGEDFLMKLGGSIRVTIFSGPAKEDAGTKMSTVDLNAEAISVTGSVINVNDGSFKVNIVWKAQDFGNDFKIKAISIHMYFVKTKDEYYMNKLEVIGITIGNDQVHKNELEVKTKNGYKVIAPIGSSFCCYDPGMFEPKKGEASEEQMNNAYSVGLTFPKMQLQVFKLSRVRFGPEWTCDMFMTIGVWVGLLVTLLFASICVWGFCMLANIQTMDRFDDPRGKSIYVPQTD